LENFKAKKTKRIAKATNAEELLIDVQNNSSV